MVSWVPGMRWVYYVRVRHGRQGLRFYGVGMGHRHPRTIALTAATAARLAGVVPFVEVDGDSAEPARTGEPTAGLSRPRR